MRWWPRRHRAHDTVHAFDAEDQPYLAHAPRCWCGQAAADAAVRVVARHVVAEVSTDWESYPNLGDADWRAVVAEVARLAPYPAPEAYQAAYDLLAARGEAAQRTEDAAP